MTTGALAAIFAGIVTLVGAAGGFWKIVADGRRSRDDRPLKTYRDLSEDLRGQLDAARRDREADRAQYARDKAEQDRRISLLERQQSWGQELTARLVVHIRYLRALLATHAPSVVLDPMPDTDPPEGRPL